ncbi:DUF2690 domain-containing protein [Streptomyces sp. 8N706]|uniref:DUF2690 domain-containing protein n=1 Tax=Streptomyces sp. 8N706 TaxID=3457416 RepID=UPI003FD497AA
MPRWRALPDELDPQVREFVSQLRRLVDRSGLSVAAVADRTGYSKTSWERYLNGRLLAPQGAVVALAEVTGANTGHLTTMWELAERAWSRSEMRHDVTMEAIRVSQARAALGEFGPPPAKAAKNNRTRKRAAPLPSRPEPGRDPGGRDAADGAPARGGGEARAGHAPDSGGSGRAGYSPDPGGSGRAGHAPDPGGSGHSPDPGGTGRAGHAPDPGGTDRGAAAAVADSPGRREGPDGPEGGDGRPRRRVALFLTGVVGVLLVIAAAVLLLGPGGGDDAEAARTSPTPGVSEEPDLPAGVKCSGKDCTGKDPETAGCGGKYAKTVADATVGGAFIEVRYSEVCGAAWARIAEAAPGDTVRITAAQQSESGTADQDNDAYTPMVAASSPDRAKACIRTKAGESGCTVPRAN